jgi:hypothetical protein
MIIFKILVLDLNVFNVSFPSNYGLNNTWVEFSTLDRHVLCSVHVLTLVVKQASL